MHIGIIMDGNRRWARKNKLKIIEGHKRGALNFLSLLDYAIKHNVQSFTVYTLSCENLQSRSKLETNLLFNLINTLSSKLIPEVKEKGAVVKILGQKEGIPYKTQEILDYAELETSQNNKILLQFCINYGGKQEILEAVKKLIKSKKPLNLENIEENLYTAIQPDLIIRTGGYQRLSNFLVWQAVYSELYFTDTLWPDFDENCLKKAIEFYNQQKRNFGK
jgi:undecaprenyl diphosphate synthase